MKALLIAALTLVSFNASAITFITEDEVQQTLGADKVIEVSKYPFQKIIDEKSDCMAATYSKSARAYVVKKENQSFLYVTTHDLANLQNCGEL